MKNNKKNLITVSFHDCIFFRWIACELVNC